MWWIMPLASVKLSFCILIYTNETIYTPDSSLFLFISIFHRHAIYIKGGKICKIQYLIKNIFWLFTWLCQSFEAHLQNVGCYASCSCFVLCMCLFVLLGYTKWKPYIYLRDWLHIAQKGRQPGKVEHSVPFLFSPCLSSMYFPMLLNW